MKNLVFTLILVLSQNTYALAVDPAQSLRDYEKAAHKAENYYRLLPTEDEPQPVTRCVTIGARTAQIYLLAELRTELGLEKQFIAMNKPALAEKAAELTRTVSELMKLNTPISDECYDNNRISAETVAAYNKKAQPLHKAIWSQIQNLKQELSKN